MGAEVVCSLPLTGTREDTLGTDLERELADIRREVIEGRNLYEERQRGAGEPGERGDGSTGANEDLQEFEAPVA